MARTITACGAHHKSIVESIKGIPHPSTEGEIMRWMEHIRRTHIPKNHDAIILAIMVYFAQYPTHEMSRYKSIMQQAIDYVLTEKEGADFVNTQFSGSIYISDLPDFLSALKSCDDLIRHIEIAITMNSDSSCIITLTSKKSGNPLESAFDDDTPLSFYMETVGYVDAFTQTATMLRSKKNEERNTPIEKRESHVILGGDRLFFANNRWYLEPHGKGSEYEIPRSEAREAITEGSLLEFFTESAIEDVVKKDQLIMEEEVA